MNGRFAPIAVVEINAIIRCWLQFVALAQIRSLGRTIKIIEASDRGTVVIRRNHHGSDGSRMRM
jgi:hypothetical protein